MNIQNVKRVGRNWAIERIELVSELAHKKRYLDLERISNEDSNVYDIETFIDTFSIKDINFEQWTDKMLVKTLDLPFFREHSFYSYIIIHSAED